MYVEDARFEKPENEKIKIWRYMDFTKFVSMLESKSLYFTKAADLNDPFEGSSRPFFDRAFKKISDLGKKITKNMCSGIEEARESWYVNCWSMNDEESAALWRLYLKSVEGIAIQSTFERLVNSLNGYPHNIYIGLVKYGHGIKCGKGINYISADKALTTKRMPFEYEKELRALIFKGNLESDGVCVKNEKGIKVQVDLNVLIESIYVSPEAKPWISELVESVIRKYGVNSVVIPSKLYDLPWS